MPHALSSEQKVERFLTELNLKRDIAASTQNHAVNAIAFFYMDVLDNPLHAVDALRATRPVPLSHAPTISETWALRQAVRDRAGNPTSSPNSITADDQIAPRRLLSWRGQGPVFWGLGGRAPLAP